MNEKSIQSHCALPDSWVAKIFAHMAAFYGTRFTDMWAGQNAEELRSVWAEKLGGFIDKPHCIKYALDCLDGRTWPPTLPEFIADCRRAPALCVAALEHKLSPDDIERNKQRVSQIAERLGRRMSA